jgi:hypothetical protein
MLSQILFDLRMALCAMRCQPVFPPVVVAPLAVGIGATTAMFALVHAALLKPLSCNDPERLVLARRTVTGRLLMWNSPPDYHDYREQAPGFDTLRGRPCWAPTFPRQEGEPDHADKGAWQGN